MAWLPWRRRVFGLMFVQKVRKKRKFKEKNEAGEGLWASGFGAGKDVRAGV